MTTDDFHQTALMRSLTALFAVAGIVPAGEPVARLSRSVRNEILRVLLPLESAVRRLIFYRMERMAAPGKATPEQGKSTPIPKRRIAAVKRKNATRVPSFRLFDKLKWYSELSSPRRRVRRGPGPRIWLLDGTDPPRKPVPEKVSRDPDDALRLCRRMQAAMRALGDIDTQAVRLKRIIAARKADPMPRQICPLRPGLPPGYRRQRVHEVDELLYICDIMAKGPVHPARQYARRSPPSGIRAEAIAVC